MRQKLLVLVMCAVAVLVAAIPGYAQKELAKSPKLAGAKTIYFEDRAGVDAVGAETVAQLKKWGRFQIVKDKKQADLIFLLSADPYKGGYVLLASGETGTIGDNGHIDKDAVPNYNVQAPVRDAYLSVIDPKTGQMLWSDSHVWGGALTGKNSAGARLVKKLAKEMGK